MIVIQLIVQMVLIGLLGLWLAMMIEDRYQKDKRIDRLMSELHDQKYRNNRMMDAYGKAMDQTVDLVGEILKAKVEPHYEPTNE